ncbi:conserved exported hypothetical protein [Nitrospina gracilis 3/211]|uniref:NHL repeat containing protein n=1 Tax=Nitrospina gracilis (strain 3/211) TaxID=1266370 RepID=M1YYM6_NITG3|nr:MULTISPECIES: hypothetical protein [Nitrospina]MCF8723514.1 DNA-binding beta-propeller fold protein YncE [Nitrospina sp. Nb-3]CCQ90585.1 conserved exported hypothetical protein [Nitrospina gracilis 3/211]
MLRTLALSILISTPLHAFVATGLDAPAGVAVDPRSGHIFIANIGGRADLKDDNGFITRLDAEGNAIAPRFISSGRNAVTLHAPKGLAVMNGVLYAADIDTVRGFDVATGKIRSTIDLSGLGVRSLTGLTTGEEGILYASDTPGNAIYRIDTTTGNTVSRFAKGPRLDGPAGLAYDPRHKVLIVVTRNTGRLLSVRGDGTVHQLFGKSFGSLYGVVFDREYSLIVTDAQQGRVYRIRNYSEVEVLKENVLSPAGIAHDFPRNRVVVTSLKGNAVFTLPLDR